MGHLNDIRASDKYVYLDTETSGIGDRAAVIQVSLGDDSGTCLFTAYVQLPPSCNMDSRAQAVHGISEVDLRANGLPWDVVYVGLMMALHTAKLDGKQLVIYNAPFDTEMIIQTCQLHSMAADGFKTLLAGWPPHDAMLAYAEYKGVWNYKRDGWKWHKLTEACQAMKLPVENAHDAMGDCKMTAALVRSMKAADVSQILDADGEAIRPKY